MEKRTMIFETHAHYDDEAFDKDRDELLQSMQENGIGTIVNVSAALHSIDATLAMTKKYPFVYGSAGVHPSEIKELTEENFLEMKEKAKDEKIVAIGEIGLDYYWDDTQKEAQKYWFRKQLDLAVEMDLPVIIHSRDAAEDTMQILKEYKTTLQKSEKSLNAVIHCYSYSAEMAEEFIKMGFYLGIGGVATFKNAKKLKEAIKKAPLTRLLLETDSPYLAPEPYRGKRNSSLYLREIAKAIADLKELEVETVIEVTEKNAREFYRINL